MNLEMSLPERPGWIFVIPGFNLIVLLLALVMLSRSVSSDDYVEVKLPPSEFRGVRLGNERPVVVMLKSTAAGPLYYIGGTKIAEVDLAATVLSEASERGTRQVAIQVDRDASNEERFTLINLLTGLNFKILEGYRREVAP